jgi:hypothetical protein
MGSGCAALLKLMGWPVHPSVAWLPKGFYQACCVVVILLLVELQALVEQRVQGRTVSMIDTELLLHARSAFLANDPHDGCSKMLLLLERCMIKEQLAAGLLQQQQVPHADPAAAAAADESAAAWSKVRPLPPDVALQLLEATAASALIGLGATYGSSGTGSYLLLPETARNQLLDPVLMPTGNLPALRMMWAHMGVGTMRRLVGLTGSAAAKAAATEVLGRCLRAAYHLAAANWRIQLQQQQDAAANAGAAGTTAEEQQGTDRPAGPAAAGAKSAAAAARASAVPLVFSEHLATLAAANFDDKMLYPQKQQQQQQQQPNAPSSSAAADGTLGAFTQAAMPLLAARCALLLSCVIGSLGVLESSLPGGAGGAKAGGPLYELLLPAVAAAQHMAALAADLAEHQQQQQQQQMAGSEGAAAAAGKSERKQRSQQHWLVVALQPLQRLLDKLVPRESAAAATGGVVTRSKAAAAGANGERRVVQMRDWCAAVLGLSKALGVELLQVGGLHSACLYSGHQLAVLNMGCR